MADLQPNVEDSFRPLKELGLSGCQLDCRDDSLFTAETAGKVRAAAGDLGVRISSLWCGRPGPGVWDFSEGYLTLGLVPPEYRYARLEFLKRGSDFAKPPGKGRVNFPRFITRLKELGCDGPITIEREISGEQQRKDILDGIALLKELIRIEKE